MGDDAAHAPLRLVVENPSEGSLDSRVAAVLEVLGGDAMATVALRWAVDVAVLRRWVRAFVDAGTAQVTNQPDPAAAGQRDRFLTAFAHELRTPLSVAQGWAAILLEEEPTSTFADDSLRRLHEALGRLAQRTFDVELLGAASLGRLQLARERVSVADLATGMAAAAEVDASASAIDVDVDPQLFGLVLRDLWEAASSSPPPRGLRLEAEAMPRWIELRVVRDGEPIDTSTLQALFEPFDLNDDGTGVTIGLYLARALTTAHGGTLGVDQDEAGAVFWVRLPSQHQSTSSEIRGQER